MGKDLEAVVRILGIDPDTREFEVVYGSVAGDPSEIVIETRSIIQILVELGSLIEVPEKDLEEGRTYRTLADSDDPTKFSELIQIHSGNRRPEEANVSIQYRGKWFWIDDRDVPRSGRLPSS
jgi:hypothetical protein